MGAYGGLLVAAGHTVVELPYVAVLARSRSLVERALGSYYWALNAVVVFFLLYFSALLVRSSISPGPGQGYGAGALEPLEALYAGIILTGGNAYFLAWWLTVGQPMLEEASRRGLKGLGVMYLSHVWMDYAWLTLLAWGGGQARLLGSGAYSLLLIVLALILLAFAAKIFLETIRGGGALLARRRAYSNGTPPPGKASSRILTG